MRQYEFKQISPEVLQIAQSTAWSLDNMDAHGAGGREVEYLGSQVNGFLDNDQRKGMLVFDYYQDNTGAYWFKNRAMLPGGAIVSMDFYLFGRKPDRTRSRRHKKRG